MTSERKNYFHRTRLNKISNILEETDDGLIDFTTADNKVYNLIITAINLHRVTLRYSSKKSI